VHDGPEIHLVENVLLQIDARSNFNQLQAFCRQVEDAALSNVEHGLTPLGSLRATERAVFDLLNKLLGLAILKNLQLTFVDRNLQITGGKSADKNNFFGVLRDIDKTTGTSQTRAKFGDIQVALLVGLRQAEEGNVEATALIKVELAG
jgi:hypothetical protein